jgi:protein-disulfide isomerase
MRRRLITTITISIALVLFLFAGRQILHKAAPEQIPETAKRTTPIIRADDPRLGPVHAPITIVEYGDFACAGCALIQPVLKEILARFPDKVVLIWKDYPLPIHPHAPQAHRAARCAQEQGQFFAYHDALFARTDSFSDAYANIATAIGLDTDAFTTCMDSSTVDAAISRSIAEGRALGIAETPTLFINNTRMVTPITVEGLREQIATELQIP